eukprot:13677368-Ditylum_brightwellii.AAC.1
MAVLLLGGWTAVLAVEKIPMREDTAVSGLDSCWNWRGHFCVCGVVPYVVRDVGWIPIPGVQRGCSVVSAPW